MKRLKDINWNHLYYFYEVAKVQSLREVAQELNLASSTLSEKIKRLENNLEKKLFKRGSKGLSLTPEGQLLFDRCKQIFEEGYKILEEFSGNALGGYPVKIGITDTISYDLANEFSSQYWDYYTQFGTVNTYRQIDHEVLIDNLSKGHIDWGISIEKPKLRSLNYAEIGSFELVFCCSEELFGRFKDPEDILHNIPFGESSADQIIGQKVSRYLRSKNIAPKEKIFSDHTGFLWKLCERGRCVMCVVENPLQKYPKMRKFKLSQPLDVTLYAIWKKSDEGLISIMKLKELINSKLAHLPHRYSDVGLQIEVSEVAEELLK